MVGDYGCGVCGDCWIGMDAGVLVLHAGGNSGCELVTLFGNDDGLNGIYGSFIPLLLSPLDLGNLRNLFLTGSELYW